MASIQNRYLNLMGAPWSPEKPQRTIMLAGYFAAAATGLLIYGAAAVNPHLEKNQLASLFCGLAGCATTGAIRRYARRNETNHIGGSRPELVIDTMPEKGTPPTSALILGRVNDIWYGSWGRPGRYDMNLHTPAIDLACIGLNCVGLFSVAVQNVFVPAYFAGFSLMHMADFMSRYRQLKKVRDLEWVISDENDALRQFRTKQSESAVNTAAPVPARF